MAIRKISSSAPPWSQAIGRRDQEDDLGVQDFNEHGFSLPTGPESRIPRPMKLRSCQIISGIVSVGGASSWLTVNGL